MTIEEKKAMVLTLVGEPSVTNDIVTAYLTKAQNAILNRMYPFEVPEDVTDVPTKYEMLQCDLASRYILRRGTEGEVIHSENGITRSYGNVNDEDLLKEVMQIVL